MKTLLISAFLLMGNPTQSKPILGRVMGPVPYSISLAFSFSGSPSLSKLQKDLFTSSLSSQIEEGLKNAVYVKESYLVPFNDFEKHVKLVENRGWDKLFYFHIHSQVSGHLITVEIADKDSGLSFPAQHKKVDSLAQLTPVAFRLAMDMFGLKGKVLEKSADGKIKGVLFTGATTVLDPLMAKKGDYLLVLRRQQAHLPIYKRMAIEIEDLSLQNGNWNFSGKLHSGIQTPVLDDLMVIRAPRAVFSQSFQFSLVGQPNQQNAPYPLEIQIHKGGPEGPIVFQGTTGNEGEFYLNGNGTQGVVFIEVSKDKKQLGVFPVFPLREKNDPVILRSTPPTTFEISLNKWKIDLEDHENFLIAVFHEMRRPATLKEELFEKAKKAKKFLKFSQEWRSRLLDEFHKIQSENSNRSDFSVLEKGKRRIQNCELYLQELRSFVSQIEELSQADLVFEENALTLTEARHFAREGDFPKAIEILVKLPRPDAQVKKDLEKYRRIWEGKSQEVNSARFFFQNELKNIPIQQLAGNKEKVAQYLETCIQAKDLAGPAIFLKQARGFLLRLENPQDPKFSEADVKKTFEFLEEEISRVQKFFASESKLE